MKETSDGPGPSVLRRLLPFTRGRRLTLFGALASTLAVVAADLARPFPLKFAIDALARTTTGGTDPRLPTLAGVGLLVVLIATTEAIGTYAADISMRRAAEGIVHDIRVALYSHLQRMSLRFHDRRAPGDLVTRLTGDVNAVGELYGESIPTVFSSVLMLTGMLIVSVMIDPVLALAVVVVTPFLGIATVRSRRSIKTQARKQRGAEGQIAALSEEALSSIRTVRALGSERFEHDRLARTSEQRRVAGEETAKVEGRFSTLIDLLGAVSTALVLVLGALRVASGALTPGDLVVMYSYSRKVYRPLRDLARQAGRMARATARAERIVEVLASDAVLIDPPNGYRGPRATGLVELHNVSFAYGDDRGVALSEISLRIQPGSRVAIVGPSGAGKSTMATILARFHDPTSGIVSIDGRDLRDCSLEWLRSQVGFVLQDTALFTGTVAENIGYGTDADTESIVTAARRAGAHDFISDLPNGYDTVLGTKAVGLSGGQRQRLAIARTILRDPPVLILDEPTSGLDPRSETLVMAGIEEATTGRTTVMITHSMAMAQRFDQVVVIDDGRIVDQGTPSELASRDGIYSQLAGRTARRTNGVPDSTNNSNNGGDRSSTVGSCRAVPAPSDPKLPQLPVLLDPDAIAEILDAEFDRPGTVRSATIRYVRYKPGTNVVIDVEMATVHGPQRAVLMAAADRDLAKRAARASSVELASTVTIASAPPPLRYLPSIRTLIQWLPLDLWLPAMAEPVTNLALRAGVELGSGDWEPELLAYKPRRRAVIAADGYVFKLYADESDFRSAAHALLSGPRLSIRTARPVAVVPEVKMTVQKVVIGEAVRDAVAVAPRAAEMLAELHRCAPPIGARQLDPLRQASATAGTITALVPHLSGEVTGLVEALSASRPTSELVMSHGDFHPKQLLDTADGLTLLDFDEMGMSSAANDMATYVAHLHDGTPVGARRAQEGLIGLIDGYGHRPPDLDWHLSTALLRRAVFPFRTYPGPDWPERIEAMVRAAQAALAQGHLTEMPA